MRKQEVQVRLIRTDGGTQTRAGISASTVNDYAFALSEGEEFPPVVVFKDESGDYWLADGFHRKYAAEKVGFGTISAYVHEGTREDAVWYSCGANRKNGLRRTNKDKRKSVEEAIKSRPDLSSRAIAEHVGVSHDLVARARKSMTEVSSNDSSDDLSGWDASSPNEIRGSEPEWLDDDEPIFSDDDWDSAIKEEERRKEALGHLRSAEKSLASLQDNLSLAERLGAVVTTLDDHYEIVHSAIQTARRSL